MNEIKKKLNLKLKNLQKIAHPALFANLRGIEKESLRVDAQGALAMTPHPAKFGAALTNPYLTTDYAESLLEFITPPQATIEQSLNFLAAIHFFTYQNLPDERLWVASMPCGLKPDQKIPLANYGSSNLAQMKLIYRRGLEQRYGKSMQTIAGIHYNFSFAPAYWQAHAQLQGHQAADQAYIDQAYLATARNFLRWSWVLDYLFGASPAICKNSLPHPEEVSFLQTFTNNSYYAPEATSLRMSQLGYHNPPAIAEQISFNSLDEYLNDLAVAIKTPYPEYVKIGVRANGEYLQLNANRLQIENEFYAPIRPKPRPLPDQGLWVSLKQGGIQYLELRGLDLNPYAPLGITIDQAYFLEAFLFLCSLVESPPLELAERRQLAENMQQVAVYGRRPNLILQAGDQELSLQDGLREIFASMYELCKLLDRFAAQPGYLRAWQQYQALVTRPENLISARLLDDIQQHQESYGHFVLRLSKGMEKYWRQFSGIDPKFLQQLKDQVPISFAAQAQLEAAAPENFEEYLAKYYHQITPIF